jgi:uncharacterized membrane protein
LPEKATHPRPRIETLSDMIFGLALSIGALSLLSKPPSTPGEVRSDIVAFAFSFLILIYVWMSYTRIMSVLPLETGATIFLSILMLFLVVIEPYLFYLVTLFGDVLEYRLVEYASVIYALDMGGLMAILAFFNHELSVEEKRLIPQEVLARHKRARNLLFVSAGLFFLTVLPQFWSWQIDRVPLRFYLWFSPLVVSWISRGLRADEHSSKVSR